MKLLTMVRKLSLLMWLVLSLATASGVLAFKTIQLSLQVAELGLELTHAKTVAATARKQAHQKVIKAVAKERAKARVRRAVVAIPLVGVLAAAGFETYQYRSWQSENPEQDFSDYSEEVLAATAEVADEITDELPAEIKSLLPEVEVLSFVEKMLAANPEQDFSDYSAEVFAATAEVADEITDELLAEIKSLLPEVEMPSFVEKMPDLFW